MGHQLCVSFLTELRSSHSFLFLAILRIHQDPINIGILRSLKSLTFNFLIYNGTRTSVPFVWITQVLEKILSSNCLEYVTLKCSTESYATLADFDTAVTHSWGALDNVLGALHLRSVVLNIHDCNSRTSPQLGILQTLQQHSPLLQSQGILEVKCNRKSIFATCNAILVPEHHTACGLFEHSTETPIGWEGDPECLMDWRA